MRLWLVTWDGVGHALRAPAEELTAVCGMTKPWSHAQIIPRRPRRVCCFCDAILSGQAELILNEPLIQEIP